MEVTAQPVGQPHKVTLEITARGWKWAVIDKDGGIIGSREMKRDKGGYRSTEKAVVFEEAMADYQCLLDSIESDDISDIARDLEFFEDDEA
jgi:hypothetical protein